MRMKFIDARQLSQEAQEAVRKRAVTLVLAGEIHDKMARVSGVARGTGSRWVATYRTNGESALNKKRRGAQTARASNFNIEGTEERPKADSR